MTDSNLPDEIPVVVEPEAQEEAYRMGFDRFEEADEIDDHWFSHYTESAEYANSILPQLRAMAGAGDTAGGTYTDHRTVVVVEFPDDRPMMGETVDSFHVFDTLADYFRRGANDAVRGNEYDPEP